MKKLNLKDFKQKLVKEDPNKSDLLDRLAGRTQACCHDPGPGPTEYPPFPRW